ncbi:hypothetical protein HPB48_008713 [Haemaphysalis longicornis]|uniref:Reverse transcriptase domain-containing protein n=1 Tax=Haemaphysalis longicornis TaxID=44386 RepID=A0A9J6GBT4_HAELO|nr:hypothetical protein HPB48_008713 [Haemaphysalis longicornis]
MKESIDQNGVVKFQNAAGLTAKGFIELFSLFLKSTFAKWNKSVYLQTSGVRVRSCVSPLLSDLFLGRVDRILAPLQQSLNNVRIFCFVDDYLVFNGPFSINPVFLPQ